MSIEHAPASEGVTIIQGAGAEAVEPPVTEAVAEAAVAIAEIEAARDIELAEIHAEARTEEAEIIADAIAEEVDETDLTLEGIAECRRNIESLQTEVMGLATLISERLPPAPPPPQEPNPEGSSENIPAETEAPPAPPPPKAKKSRWI